MRYATIVLGGENVQISPILNRFVGSDAVRIDSTRHIGPIEDGQHVVLVDLQGDLSTAEDLLADSSNVVRYDVTGTNGRGVAYLRCRSIGLIGDLLSILYAHDIVLDWPIHHAETPAGRRYRFTVIGTESGIQRAMAQVPDEISIELEKIGPYGTRPDQREAVLTDRQSDLLELAVEEGYYEVPRETTHRALAEELGLSVGTVSDRLQRIERRLVLAATD
ncbi:helix-turn-helix domain-containing protein [Halostagnicola kamekurae]|uniref:helix-turn-helix domain-containing protein n=1 Tax=Halostagnicola kamekurae TaxID=619731 RepID=UPI000B885D2F|nr:helix-turn-helix domain-containing protein [Halostagnicola kamekurae]